MKLDQKTLEKIEKNTGLNMAQWQKMRNLYSDRVQNGFSKPLQNSPKKIILRHGCSSKDLPSILKYGLRPKEHNDKENWTGTTFPSLQNLVYLTDKWHYFFAVNAIEEVGDDHPCYVEVEVPVSSLVLDEDIFLSQYMEDLLKGKEAIPDTFNIEEAIEQYGTVAHLGNIKPDQIIGFGIMADPSILLMTIQGPYYIDYLNWQKGASKGSMTVDELKVFEQRSLLNKYYDIADIPVGKELTDIVVKEKSARKIRLVLKDTES